MTCVVAVPVREGLVVAADRLSTTDDEQPIDEATKLHPLRRGLFVCSGKTGYGTNAAGTNLFDAVALTRAQLARKRLDGVNWTTFRTTLGQRLKRTLEQLTPELRPPISTASSSLIQVLTFFVDGGGGLRLSVVRVEYQQTDPVLLNLVYENAAPENFATARPILAASLDVWAEIQGGTDPRFDDLRADELFQRFFSPPPAAEVSADEAVAFARRLIVATAERNHLLGGGRTVGPTTDVILLERSGGLQQILSDGTRRSITGDAALERKLRNEAKRKRRGRH